jgi:hypothetical protein
MKMQTLQGKKTYIVATVAGIALVAHLLGYIDRETFQAVLVALGIGGIVTLKAGMNRIEKDTWPPPP